ncbi:MAG TPA: cysteine dioxygenase family protein [Acidimicrobiales bacterium]|nr:cysteine dioxygenase family protein [Acidimicrobiales bacterium]
MTRALHALVAAVDAALRDPSLRTERAKCEAMRPAMEALLHDPDPIPSEAREPWEGQAVGNLLHADPEGRFHVLAVVFPEGTSSGVHHHGCWGVIGYLQGGDEETRYRDDRTESSRHVWHQGDVTCLLPEEGEGWHRVRNPGPGVGVSVHVLCMAPAEHPHRFWVRETDTVVPFPFVEVAPGRWRAELQPAD